MLNILTSIGAGIQAITGGLELIHWNQFIGRDKCSVQKGACTCIGVEKIRISNCEYYMIKALQCHCKGLSCQRHLNTTSDREVAVNRGDREMFPGGGASS